VTYVVYTDEGHGFVRPENRLDFTAREEKFIAKTWADDLSLCRASECLARPP
jgi:dipeptidyl aminopeptidase/acylaminoacyl peptidase